LSVYNGEQFIADQLDSLLQQTYQDFHIYACDDCSTDSTYAIIQDYCARYPGRIAATRSAQNSGGAKHNAIRLMIEHREDYLMLCDQDDVWLPNKIEITLAKLKEMENRYGIDVPLMVHTDLEVVDAQLETIQPSFWAAMNSNCYKNKLHNLVIQNIITGCTVMYNRALAELIWAEPGFMVMHDWWLGLAAAAFGYIEPMEIQTIKYRQHANNDIGAKDVRTMSYKFKRLLNYGEVKHAVNMTYRQAESFLEMYRERLTAEQIRLLVEYSAMPNHNKVKKWITICRLGTFKNGVGRKIAQFLFI